MGPHQPQPKLQTGHLLGVTAFQIQKGTPAILGTEWSHHLLAFESFLGVHWVHGHSLTHSINQSLTLSLSLFLRHFLPGARAHVIALVPEQGAQQGVLDLTRQSVLF